MHTLVITPDARVHGDLARALQKAGLHSVWCRNRWTTAMATRRRRPDLAIVDWRFPNRSGLAAAERLRSAPEGERTFILAILQAGEHDGYETILSAGVDDFLSVPLDRARVEARLRIILAKLPPASPGPAAEGGQIEVALLRPSRDPCSGLPDRTALIDSLRRDITSSGSEPSGLALVLCSLDHFDKVNASVGCGAGDRLLRTVAERLLAASQTEWTVAAVGGARFAIVARDITDRRDITAVADRIRRVVGSPVKLGDIQVFPSLSLGIAAWKPLHQQPDDLLRDAHAALHMARERECDHHVVFEPAMHDEISASLRLENELRGAIAHSEFQVSYQPIVNVDDGSIHGFEGLVRWQHPDRGLLLPSHFISVAEQTGLIIQLDRWVMEEACRQLRAWQVHYRRDPPLTMSVNVSTTQFMQPDLVTQLDLILRRTGVYGQSLTIEVTESALMENAQYAAAMLAQLRRLGMGISIDDFGTGYSSLSYLRRFEVDALKIDVSFVNRMLEDEESAEIVRSITSLAANLGKITVAEGVETRSQLESLRALGVDRVQGSFIAAPLDAVASEKLLSRTAASDNHLGKILSDRLHPEDG